MLSPKVFSDNGIPVYTALQKPGQFIITYPRAYHAGFNLGFNIAESVNFATEEWIPYCRLAVQRYRFNRLSTFSYEDFVIRAAKKPDNLSVAKILHRELIDIIKDENELLSKVYSDGLSKLIESCNDSIKYCEVCGYDLTLSFVCCSNHNKYGCLMHATEICDCKISEKSISIKTSISSLNDILNKLEYFIRRLS